MKLFLLLLLGGVLGAADYVKTTDGVLLPDPRVTPGAVRTSDAREICAKSFRTAPFRKTTKTMKKAVCAAYGVKPCPHARALEIDHLLPLELGGRDDARNLWPQPAKPRPGFHEKDALENYLHAEVCAGHLSLSTAQYQIMTNWYAAWLAMNQQQKQKGK